MSPTAHGNALPAGYHLREYRIESVLGQGGFGITYKAFDTALERQVAVKEYLPVELAVREHDSTVRPFTEERADMFRWGLDRFIKEARTLAKLNHPNIVKVFAVLEHNATAYMVMPLENGQPLEDLIKFGRLTDESRVLAIAYAILDGLEHVHEAGFLHRDIKPANIFVKDSGTPLLIDFGSARVTLGTQAKSRMTSVVSPGYAPYEQYHGDSNRQGPWTDLYGLAATLYAVVGSGRAPIDALIRGDARIEGKPDPIDQATTVAKGTWSKGFLAAIDSALAFRPEERPQSVAEWRESLGTNEPDEEPTELNRRNRTNQPEEEICIDEVEPEESVSLEIEDDEEWNLLVKYDDEFRAAVESVAIVGNEAIRELRRAFRAVGDKSKLRNIAKTILRERSRELVEQAILEDDLATIEQMLDLKVSDDKIGYSIRRDGQQIRWFFEYEKVLEYLKSELGVEDERDP